VDHLHPPQQLLHLISISTIYKSLHLLQQQLLNIEGLDSSINLNDAIITPNFSTIVRLSQQYGEEAGVGGNVTWFSGSIPLIPGVQDYDLSLWAAAQNITGGIEIKNIFFHAPPAINQLYNPIAYAELGGAPAVGSYGLGYGTTGYLMVPTSLTIQTAQAIEMQNTVIGSNYTFEIINNKLRIFPVPDYGNIYSFLSFQYIKVDDRINDSIQQTNGNKVTNESNASYSNPVYTQINSIGRQWIFEYTLALSKEMLGYVRGKYSTIPIPGDAVTLNQQDLLSSATESKNALIERLRTYFNETSNQSLLERRAAESEARVKEINYSPMTIYIG